MGQRDVFTAETVANTLVSTNVITRHSSAESEGRGKKKHAATSETLENNVFEHFLFRSLLTSLPVVF